VTTIAVLVNVQLNDDGDYNSRRDSECLVNFPFANKVETTLNESKHD